MNPEFLRALDLAKGLDDTPKNLTRVAAETTVDAARWAFGQRLLRKRAQSKFSRAEHMLFDREGLEMASHERISAWRAARFPADAPIVDVGCGLGGDLISFGLRRSDAGKQAIGYELNEQRASYARWNLAANQSDAEVVVGDGLAAARKFEFGFADPSRRSGGQRILDAERFEPALPLVLQAFEHMRLYAIKLSPMLSDQVLQQPDRATEFVSFGGECREALLWGGLGVVPGVSCHHIESGERLEPSGTSPTQSEPGEYLFDCDPAAGRAHCIGRLCTMYELAALGDSNGYLTGSTVVRSPWLRAYRVQYAGPADPKRTRAALRERGAHVFETKQRIGAKVETLRETKWPSYGGVRLSLVIWLEQRRQWHALVSSLD